MKAVIALAIALVSPSLPKAQRLSYAEAIQRAERRHELPGLLAVAIIENESHFRRTLTSGSGTETMVGLGQIRLGNYRPCREDLDGAGCQAVRALLLDGVSNIGEMGKTYQQNRRYCTRRGKRGVGPALAGYQGYGCKPGPLTRKVLRRWRDLEQRLSRGGRRR